MKTKNNQTNHFGGNAARGMQCKFTAILAMGLLVLIFAPHVTPRIWRPLLTAKSHPPPVRA